MFQRMLKCGKIMNNYLTAPFPYFGGKAQVAKRIWMALGQPDHYIEPFAGSLSVLLARPGWSPDMTETANDADGVVTNAWRSIQLQPDETARWCDWPVNHIDLAARKAELIRNEERLVENLVADPQWCDPILGGYWIWAASCWIGSGLCSLMQIPNLSCKGGGVHKVSLGIKIPHLSDKGKGVHKVSAGIQIPNLSHKGMGVHATTKPPIYDWFEVLSYRLRRVRLICGDWTRVCGGDWQDAKWENVGMFFDPPYGVEDRDTCLYGQYDSTEIAREVMAWCKERGKRSNYRIVLAGYEEYEPLLDDGWTFEAWKARGGYANTAPYESRGKKNKHRERLYFSPLCGIQERLL